MSIIRMPGGWSKIEYDDAGTFAIAIEIPATVKEGTTVELETPSIEMSDGNEAPTGKKLTMNVRSADATTTPQQPPSAGNVQIVSSAAGDTTQNVTVAGRNGSGVLIAETKQLSGQTPVPMTVQTAWGLVLRALKAATCAGDVAAEAVTATRSNTAQAGGATTITLDAGASSTNDAYRDMVIRLTSGTGVGQIRRIISYVGSTKVATVNRAWGTNPDGTSGFKISVGLVVDVAPVEAMEARGSFYADLKDAETSLKKRYFRFNSLDPNKKLIVKNIVPHVQPILTPAGDLSGYAVSATGFAINPTDLYQITLS